MKNIRAFSLIEVIVVMGIMVMVLGITVVYVFNFRGKSSLEVCAKEISGVLSLARSRAITKIDPHKVFFDINTEAYDLMDSNNTIIHSYLAMDGVDIESTTFKSPDDTVEFNSTGALTGVRGYIYI